jgi:hypothetical protein
LDIRGGGIQVGAVDSPLRQWPRWSKIIDADSPMIETTSLYLSPDQALTFQLTNGKYAAAICIAIQQQRGQCDYILVATTFNSDKKPTIEDLMEKHILGGQIESAYASELIKERQPGIERVWKYEAGNYFFGLFQLAINHKDFEKFNNKFENVGSLKVVEGLKRSMIFGYASTFDKIDSIFRDLDGHAKAFRLKKYPVTVLCD